ncbi:hypothetical protein NPIL_460861 [Nephila pilipes]|uniref:Uncharacterized protein n=1 Tax=Nephila pilipes TaxID=299642 RepID=A0A8X6NPZ9_NEPPI|nr:hypothetical protein NPIL_460861 [Nephila pilipes]
MLILDSGRLVDLGRQRRTLERCGWQGVSRTSSCMERRSILWFIWSSVLSKLMSGIAAMYSAILASALRHWSVVLMAWMMATTSGIDTDSCTTSEVLSHGFDEFT